MYVIQLFSALRAQCYFKFISISVNQKSFKRVFCVQLNVNKRQACRAGIIIRLEENNLKKKEEEEWTKQTNVTKTIIQECC